MKTAIYHQHGRPGAALQVLAEHNGTVDLGDLEGNLLVAKCPLSATPLAGHATLVTDSENKPEGENTPEGENKQEGEDDPEEPQPEAIKPPKPPKPAR